MTEAIAVHDVLVSAFQVAFSVAVLVVTFVVGRRVAEAL